MAPPQRASAEGALRTSIIQAVIGFPVVIGLYFTARNLGLTRLGQLTERFSKAIEQLGDPDINVRIGALYALEAISRDSRQFAVTIQEIIIRFINAKTVRFDIPEGKHDHGKDRLPDADLEVALIILGRRPYSSYESERIFLAQRVLCNAQMVRSNFQHADFSYSYLCGVRFHEANLRDAFFRKSCMRHAILSHADARGATFIDTDLRGSFLNGVNLDNSILVRADLRNAVLGDQNAGTRPASLNKTDLRGAQLDGAELYGLDLRYAIGLTQDQVNSAVTDHTTRLPEGIQYPPPNPDRKR
jgi:hypothetical protein